MIFMKSKEEIKAELHKKIDSIEDEHTLQVLNDDIVPYVLENRTKEKDDDVEELTEAQEQELAEAIKEADNGETVSWDDFLKSTQQWRTK
jgi:hypothetical protein